MVYLAIILGLVMAPLSPWWAPGIAMFVLGFMDSRLMRSFAVGFFGMMVPWVMLSYYYDLKSFGVIGQRLADMFGLPTPFLVMGLAGVVGGVFGSSCSVTGQFFKRTWKLGVKEKTS